MHQFCESGEAEYLANPVAIFAISGGMAVR